VEQVILAGDFVHFANFSAWGAEFKAKPLAMDTDKALMEIISLLPDDKKATAYETMDRYGLLTPDSNITIEIKSVRKTVKELEGAMGNIKYIMGNHEQRKLRAQDMGESPDELLTFFEADKSKWTVSAYYWCTLKTDNPYLYRIEHPRMAGKQGAVDIAVQEQQNVIMGHSHRWAMNRDPSGRLYAIQAGHCVDEMRLAYVKQRTAKRDAHALGAVIVRGGYPYLLEENSPWEQLKKA
jgi:hypothetical protein